MANSKWDNYSDDELLNILKEKINELGFTPNGNDLTKYNLPSIDTYKRKFKVTWNGLLEIINVDKNNKFYSKEEAVERLINFCDTLGRNPTKQDFIDCKWKPTIIVYNRYFGGLINALKSIGKLEILSEDNKRCTICNKILHVSEFQKGNNELLNPHCRVCDYFKRHKDIKIKHDWTIEEYKILIDYILNNKCNYVNELVTILKHKIIDICLVIKELKINSKHMHLKVLCNCKNCNKSIKKPVSVYLKNQEAFCSKECYWINKKEVTPKGKDNKQYNRILTQCDNCGENIEITLYDMNATRHHFCTQSCYWQFRSKYYIGERANKIVYTEEMRNKLRERTAKMYSDGIFDRQTLPQRIVNEILTDLNLEYENEYTCKYYSIDNYLKEHNLMIEVMGDYFHGHPEKNSIINDMQLKNIIKDKRKHTYIKRYENIEVLYLWEDDILNNIDKVINIIKLYINNEGVLPNYHSFNYDYEEDFNEIIIKKSVIKNYMEFTSEELNSILISSEQHEKLKIIKKLEHNTKFWDECNCKYCNKPISVLKSRKENSEFMFCNKECKNSYYQEQHVTVNCDFCNKEIDIHKCKDKSNKLHFCNNECKLNYQRKDAVIVYCDNCGKAISRTANRAKNQKHSFCDKKCYMEYRKNTGFNNKKRNDENWIKFNCECCGKESEQLLSQYQNANIHFCSKECSRTYKKIKV
jgi:very-short-patch-repair endonuclease